MKLFKVITVSISLLLSNTALADTKGQIGKMPPAEWWGEQLKYSTVNFRFRRTQYLGFWLKREEKSMHQSAVYFALNNAHNGEIVSWYSKKRLAGGKVRVIHSYPISGGYCRTYQAFIQVKGKSRNRTNNACKYINDTPWLFYK